MITQDRLRQLFLYDPEQGVLIWKDRPASDFKTVAAYGSFRARWAGKQAGHIGQGGYVHVMVGARQRLAHKLIWCFVFGEWPTYPEFEIDHVNGDRSDNRIQNLRKVTKSMNQRNGCMRKNNKSGVIGVNWVESKQAWIARIWDGSHHKYLGQFYDIEAAAAARTKAELELGYHPGHGKQSKYVEAQP